MHGIDKTKIKFAHTASTNHIFCANKPSSSFSLSSLSRVRHIVLIYCLLCNEPSKCIPERLPPAAKIHIQAYYHRLSGILRWGEVEYGQP